MTTATLVFLGLAFTKPRDARIFHYITAGVTMVASIAYFTMGSGLGWTPISVEYLRLNPKVAGHNREIFYARYIDWVITTPLLLMDLLLTAGMPWPTVLWVILVDLVMIICGLIGALVPSSYKWGYFTFGMAALGYIGYMLMWEARRNANALGKDVGPYIPHLRRVLHLVCGVCIQLRGAFVKEGNIISPDSEAVFYGILDLIAKTSLWCIADLGPP